MPQPPSEGRIPPDVLARALAISFVVFNHAAVVPQRSFDLGGGLSALILLAGYAFARFTLANSSSAQLRAGIRRYAVSFGGPCLLLVLLSFAVRRSFSWSELLFFHNYVAYKHLALFYNWYAEAFLQLLALIYLLSFWRPWIRSIERRPWATSLASTLVALALMLIITEVWAPGNRFPHYLMWQFLFGWVIYFALHSDHGSKRRRLVTLLLAVLFSLIAFPLVQPLRIPFLIGTSALLLYTRSIRVGVIPARILALISQATLTLFLTHWLLLQMFDHLHLRRYSTGFHLQDVLFAWGTAMVGGVGFWLLASSTARAWHYMRRAIDESDEVTAAPVLKSRPYTGVE